MSPVKKVLIYFSIVAAKSTIKRKMISHRNFHGRLPGDITVIKKGQLFMEDKPIQKKIGNLPRIDKFYCMRPYTCHSLLDFVGEGVQLL